MLGGFGAKPQDKSLGALRLARTGANKFTGAQTLPGNAANPLEAVPKQQAESLVATVAGRNRIINGVFSVNQRAFTGGSLAAGAYGHDRWKAGAGGTTYSVTGEVATITNGTLLQIIEGLNVAEGGTYTLSWIGTAQARIDGGDYALGPITVTGKTAGANTTIEFGVGTVGRVQYESGTVSSTFERRLLTMEHLLCYRYAVAFRYTTTSTAGVGYYAEASGQLGGFFYTERFPVDMRSTPSLSIQTGAWATTPPPAPDISNQRLRWSSSSTGFYLQGTPGAVALLLSAEL
jgi:hypothetical protein